jgi:hypothetical protein
MASEESNPQDTFVIEGLAVASHAGEVRLLLDGAALDLDERDVVSVGELPPPRDLIASHARAVRLELRRGARLLRVSNAGAYDDVVWRRGHLFAMRSRRGEATRTVSDGYHARARTFLAGYGIGAASEDQP